MVTFPLHVDPHKKRVLWNHCFYLCLNLWVVRFNIFFRSWWLVFSDFFHENFIIFCIIFLDFFSFDFPKSCLKGDLLWDLTSIPKFHTWQNSNSWVIAEDAFNWANWRILKSLKWIGTWSWLFVCDWEITLALYGRSEDV